ncbi:MAG: alpha/beta hydrolase, partial [Calditrichaeota bacterium]|nr:alpha/beta hydrolase [Calditrichota bacterium]
MKLLYLLIFTCLAAQPGKLIELNGYRLHYIESGSGKPVIVFFYCAGDIALMWKPVINQLSDEFHSVAIDEHGNGWSEFGQINHSLRQQAFDSKQLLSKAKLNGPYILIGHSRGALVALEFFRQFKNNVIGIVLVDPSHPDM